MKMILTAAQLKEADQRASGIGIPSMVLMERAALAVVSEILGRHLDTDRVLVVCGSGNNGGDGAAVARLLAERGAHPTVYLAGKREKFSDQMQQQMKILEHFPVRVLSADYENEGHELDNFSPERYSLIIDAVFGIGIRREVTGIYADVINRINAAREQGAAVIAVDMPSGVHTNSGAVYGTAVRADLTVTFTTGKSGLYCFPGAAHAGEVVVKKIGIPVPADMADACRLFSVEEDDLKILPARDESGNKGTFGKILVIAGSKDIFGAAYLSAKAALMSGFGMVRVYTEETNRAPLAALFPEALLTVYSESAWDEKSLLKAMDWADAFLVGPGLGTGETSLRILEAFLSANREKPAVFDADALNLFAAHMDLFGEIRFPAVFTPHVGEMSRLSGIAVPDIKRELVTVARRAAQETGQIVILKDARTVTALPDGRCFLNLSGNSALATAGTGDVLAGITAALFAEYGQADLPVPAAALAPYIHGRCGEMAAEKYSEASAKASDLLEFLHCFLK